MSAVELPSRPVADAVFADLRPRIDSLRTRGITPGLATVLIGDDDASARYVAMKMAKASHTGVPDWHDHARRADILVAAAGAPGMIQPEHVKPGAVVIGAGVRYDGRRLLPDVDEACAETAGWITPRVGGVGPTTIAMLFRNLVESAERQSTPRG